MCRTSSLGVRTCAPAWKSANSDGASRRAFCVRYASAARKWRNIARLSSTVVVSFSVGRRPGTRASRGCTSRAPCRRSAPRDGVRVPTVPEDCAPRYAGRRRSRAARGRTHPSACKSPRHRGTVCRERGRRRCRRCGHVCHVIWGRAEFAQCASDGPLGTPPAEVDRDDPPWDAREVDHAHVRTAAERDGTVRRHNRLDGAACARGQRHACNRAENGDGGSH